MTPIIETHNITRRFRDTGDGEILAVADLTLEIQAGEIFGFLGHNGAGKTTTVRLLNGVLNPTAGTLRVLGLDPVKDGPTLRRQTGVLTETPSLDDKLTARETLTIYGKLYAVDPEVLARRVHALLAEFDLAERADEYVGGFSKGMRQRLALARTLLHQPSLLFLDEPTAGLDPVGRRDVHKLITRSDGARARTIFLCTHDLIEAQKLCDRVGVMERGRLVALGTPRDLARELYKGIRLEILLDTPPPEAVFDDPVLAPAKQTMTWDAETKTAALRLPEEDEIPHLIKALVEAGARIFRVTPLEPTLEDVYFALHDQENKAVHHA